MQTQRVELHLVGERLEQTLGEVDEHVLARGLVVYRDYTREVVGEHSAEKLSLLGAAYDECVVEARDDLLVDYPLEQSEVHDHTLLGVVFVGRGFALDGDEEAVRVTVYLAAGAVISLEGVRGLERELLGKTYCSHKVAVLRCHNISFTHVAVYKDNVFIETRNRHTVRPRRGDIMRGRTRRVPSAAGDLWM